MFFKVNYTSTHVINVTKLNFPQKLKETSMTMCFILARDANPLHIVKLQNTSKIPTLVFSRIIKSK